MTTRSASGSGTWKHDFEDSMPRGRERNSAEEHPSQDLLRDAPIPSTDPNIFTNLAQALSQVRYGVIVAKITLR